MVRSRVMLWVAYKVAAVPVPKMMREVDCTAAAELIARVLPEISVVPVYELLPVRDTVPEPNV